MGKKKQHEWGYMGWDEERQREYSHCALCDGWRASTPHGIRRISGAEYRLRVAEGKVVIR